MGQGKKSLILGKLRHYPQGRAGIAALAGRHRSPDHGRGRNRPDAPGQNRDATGAECGKAGAGAAIEGAGVEAQMAGAAEMKDAFDQWWEWVNKPRESTLTIPSDLHFVMTERLSREDWNDREKVNRAVEEYRRGKI